MTIKDTLLDAYHFRHACKLFDSTRKIPQTDLDFILEAGRLSPSSVGLEHWKFIIVRTPQLKVALQHACADQPQISSCSDLLIILARKAELHPDSSYVKNQFDSLQLTPEQTANRLRFYRDFIRDKDIGTWSIAQCHIAAANMMTAAAAIGIDSCPIGAFVPAQVRAILHIDEKEYEVALVLPLGYRKNPPPQKHRLPIAALVEYR